jgi:hypothetical protein
MKGLELKEESILYLEECLKGISRTSPSQVQGCKSTSPFKRLSLKGEQVLEKRLDQKELT